MFNLYLTPDAGSRDVYTKIKGADYFDNVLNNINQYIRKTNGKAIVKFIIDEGNIDDVENMISTSVKNNVQNIVLSFDLNIKPKDYDSYRNPVNKFIYLASKNNLKISLTDFVPKILFK